jgi:FecR protein
VKKPPTALRLFIAALCVATVAHAQDRRKNPTSKLYVADTKGETQIDTGKEIDDLTKKSVYNAQGTVLETKPDSNASVVLSNGTGIYIDVGTRLEIRRFEQESFRPNRNDVEDEPSISTTQLFLDHGVIGISTSKMVAGSTMEFETSLASAWMRGRQCVVMSGDGITVISMVQGDAEVQAGPLDTPRTVKNGQQIIITPGKTGERNNVLIQDIPDGAIAESRLWLNERVLTANDSRQLVYFEVQGRKGGDGSIALFDGANGTAASSSTDSGSDIVGVPVVPVVPPITPTVSAANLSSR